MPLKMVLPSCSHVAGLAVHQLGRADHVAAKGRADGLVAEADAENRNLAGHVADEVDGDAGLLRRAGAGREEDAVRVQGFDLVRGQLVVAADDDVGAELAHVLDEVVGEGVVVVEDEDHCVQCSAGCGCRHREAARSLSRTSLTAGPAMLWGIGGARDEALRLRSPSGGVLSCRIGRNSIATFLRLPECEGLGLQASAGDIFGPGPKPDARSC